MPTDDVFDNHFSDEEDFYGEVWESLGDEEWEELQDAIATVLNEHGEVASLGQLAGAEQVAEVLDDLDIIGADVRLRIVDDALLDMPDAFRAPDGRVARLSDIVEGLVLTHDLNQAESGGGYLEITTDLTPLLVVSTEFFPLQEGGTAEMVLPPLDEDIEVHEPWKLVGPEVWLDIEPGTRVAVRIVSGALSVERLADPPGDDGSRTGALRRAFDLYGAEGGSLHEPDIVEIGDLVIAAMALDPEPFRRPGAPLSEFFPAAGFSIHGDLAADAGFDWEEWRRRRMAVGAAVLLARRHDLEAEQAVQLMFACDTYNLAFVDGDGGGDIPEDRRRASLQALEDPGVLDAFVHEIRETWGPDALAHLGAFARLLLADARGAQAAPLHLLLAEDAASEGRVADAEKHVTDAVDLDPDHRLARWHAARFASDRGNASRALEHLRRAGASDGGMVEMLASYARPGPTTAGRNEPCPCGSGRKHKVCCAHRNGWPLRTRVPWLLHKLRWYLVATRWYEEVVALASELAGVDSDGPDLHDIAHGHPLLHDLTIFEEGALERFLAERGPLLPADELDLARQWVGIPRGLYEVTAMPDETDVELLDLRSGDHAGVGTPFGLTEVGVGQALYARVLPDGSGGHQMSSGIVPVGLAQRPAVLELVDSDADAYEIAAFFAPRPPVLRNTEGQELVFCEARFAVDDPDKVSSQLRETFEELESGRFVDTYESMGTRFHRAMLDLDGASLTISANSEERFDDVLDRLADVSGLRLEEESRHPFDPVDFDPEEVGDLLDLDDLPPEVREALDEHIRRAEEAWVDEPIPALGGATPREALDDPTRRGDLLALLDGFEGYEARQEGGSGFRVVRLRALLGLDDER